MTDSAAPAIIYNLFPPLAGSVDHWIEHARRAAGMGFNWLFLNPIHLPGASGSLYSVRDYFRFNPLLFPAEHFPAQKAAFVKFVADCRELGLEVMADLVVNHTAYDNPLTREHRDWYVRHPDGAIKSPGARDDSAPGGYVTWGDLSEIDNLGSPDREHLWAYWERATALLLSCGVRGFRCDAAYQAPTVLWRRLIDFARTEDPDVRFFAETLGCPMESTLELGKLFDYVFNSGKWWNYRDDWYLEQANALAAAGARTVGFAESHDTRRLADEWNGDRDRAAQHYLFTALASAGALAPIGFEYGFRKRLHVVGTRPRDWEGAGYDLTDFIREVNALKRAHRALAVEGKFERFDAGDVLLLIKTTPDGKDSALLAFNRSDAPLTADWAELSARAGLPPLVAATGSAADGARAPERLRLARYGAVVLRLHRPELAR